MVRGEIGWKDLLALPDGSFFYESDCVPGPIMQKLENWRDNDIVVRYLWDDVQDHMRLGLPEMDDVDRNSKAWRVLSLEDRMAVAERISGLTETVATA